MSLKLNEYRVKLITKIIFASSQDEVNRYIDAAMKSLDAYNVNGHTVSLFVTKIIAELDLFSPLDKDAQQWSNIKIAKIMFTRIKNRYNAQVS